MPPPLNLKRRHTKTRTGCMTCKRRRVKCDEGRPICLRCFKASLYCEGYNAPTALIFDFEPPSVVSESSDTIPQRTLIRKAENHVPSSLSAYGGTLEEQGALQYYLEKTSPLIVSYTSAQPLASIWTNLLPQTSHQQPAVRHALSAVSLLDKSQTSYATNSRDAELSIRHSQIAIRWILLNSLPLEIIVLTSILLFAFESFRGNARNAKLHINSAKRMIEEHMQNISTIARGQDPTLTAIVSLIDRSILYVSTVFAEQHDASETHLHRSLRYELTDHARVDLISWIEGFTQLENFDLAAVLRATMALDQWHHSFGWSQRADPSLLERSLLLLYSVTRMLLQMLATENVRHRDAVVEYILSGLKNTLHYRGSELAPGISAILLLLQRLCENEAHQTRIRGLLKKASSLKDPVRRNKRSSNPTVTVTTGKELEIQSHGAQATSESSSVSQPISDTAPA